MHVASLLRHNLTIGITSGLMPLEATQESVKGVAMLCKLTLNILHHGLVIKVRICEEHRFPPVVKLRLLPQLAPPPTTGNRHHLGLRGTDLDEVLSVEGYDNRQHKGSDRDWSLANDLFIGGGVGVRDT